MEALVILAVGLLGHWKAPIAYFLTSKLSAALQGELLRHAIIELESVGLSTVALVMDGLAANIRMVKEFGCNLHADNISPFFPNPVDPSKQIAVVLDACHMLKLMRNTLHCYKAISVPGKGIARFHHLRLLNDTQNEEGLRGANRLTTRHIDFVRQKMKVKLAAQLFSSSVAKALNLARLLGVVGFDDSEPTEYLCTVIDRLFDILNSKSPRALNFKAPLSARRLVYHRSFLEETAALLLNLATEDGKLKICESRRSMGVLGFVADIKSILFLAQSILGLSIAGKPILYICTYLDHLEIMFACIRKAGGFNNNPTAKQFQATFKKLMFRSGVALTPSDCANITAQDDTTFVIPDTAQYASSSTDDICDSGELNFVMFEDAVDDHGYSMATMRLSPFVDNILVYIAGWVVRAVMKRLRCLDC
jgi:hypothetical protein